MNRYLLDTNHVGEAVWIRLGQTEAGRYLQVVYVPDPGGDSAFVVTAYDLTPKAKRAYRRRQRRKTK